MPTSDSEGFESADEDHVNFEKKGRKSRNSSSNYSDTAVEPDLDPKKTTHLPSDTEKVPLDVEETDGWDDFDIDDNEPVTQSDTKLKPNVDNKPKPGDEVQESKVSTTDPKSKSQDTGWDDFDDWGDANVVTSEPKLQKQTDKDVIEHLAATTTTPSSGGWGWGWGVDSLISSATAGLTTITNQVSQGITTVLESGISAPDPEELAKKSIQVSQENTTKTENDENKEDEGNKHGGSGDGAFASLAPLGSLLTYVGNTVISGGLDTLEIIGRKTMEALQDGDPFLERKRALLGLNPDIPSLSAVLREAKDKAEAEDKIKEERMEAKQVHYENLFDDFGGLVHLEALEMLSKQCHFKIEEALQNAPPEKKRELRETVQQVGELCELPEEEAEDEFTEMEKEKYRGMPNTEALHERLQKATEDLGVKLQFQPLVKQYEDILAWTENEDSDFSHKVVHKRAISNLAQTTALCVELFHKSAEMLLVRERRMVADEADALTQMTGVLIRHIAELGRLHADIISREDFYTVDTTIKDVITNVYLVANNSSAYVQNALLLLTPILQIGVI